MSITPAFYLHGTPHPIHRSGERKIAPKQDNLLFATDDPAYARCYTIKDQNCIAVAWDNGKYHIILINEPDDLDRPGYIYQIPTSDMNFQEHSNAEFITKESHPVTGPNSIVHGIRELIEEHDVQIYIIPKDVDPKTFSRSLNCPSVVTMQGYLTTLGCRHLNDEWKEKFKHKIAPTKQTTLDRTL